MNAADVLSRAPQPASLVDDARSSRETVLALYRQYRRTRGEQQTAAFAKVTTAAVTRHARSLGMLQGKSMIVADNEHDLHLVYDLAVHTPGRNGVRAIDRYARTNRPRDDDGARVLAALQDAWFSIFIVKERHPVAGLVLIDMMRGTETWLMDESLEASAPEKMILAMRLCEPDAFAMTCGAMVPLDREIMSEFAGFLEEAGFDGDLAELADQPRFAASVYRMALDLGLTDKIRYQDTPHAAE